MAVRISDIAAEVGVSYQVVSKVLNGGKSRANASAATRQRILEAADRLGYRPNTAARAVSTGRFGAVGLIMNASLGRSRLPDLLLHGIHDALTVANLHLNVHFLSDEQLTDETALPKFLRESMVDGIIINYTHGNPPALDTLLQRYPLPAIWTNNKRTADCVYPDDYSAGRIATEHLLAMGHRRIAFVDYFMGDTQPELKHYSSIDRLEGYSAAMRDAGLQPRLIRGNTPLHGRAAVQHSREIFASEKDRPTAIIAEATEHVAITLLAAEALGIESPRDLSVITFGTELQQTSPGLISAMMVLPHKEEGRTAVRSLLEGIRTKKPQPPIALPFTLAPGQTLAPPTSA